MRKRSFSAIIGGAVSGLIILVGLAACAQYNDDRGKGDAPVGETHETERQVWNNIHEFPSVSAWCIGADAVYTVKREAPPVVIKDSANCAEGGILFEG